MPKQQHEKKRSLEAPLTASRPELLVNGSDAEFRKLIHGLFSFLTLHASIRNGYAALLNLPGPQYTIMLCIRHLSGQGPVKVGAIATKLRQSGSFITVETNKLEKLGLVSKKREETDRRTVSLTLTDRGRELLDSIAPLRRQVNDIQFGCLTADEFQTLVPLVERLIDSGERALALLNYFRQEEQYSGERNGDRSMAELVGQ